MALGFLVSLGFTIPVRMAINESFATINVMRSVSLFSLILIPTGTIISYLGCASNDYCLICFFSADVSLGGSDIEPILQDFDSVLYLSVESLEELIVAYRNKGLWANVWKSEQEMVQSVIDSSITILPLNS